MKITYIKTEDGRTLVEWWEKQDFTNRTSRIYTADDSLDLILGKNLKLESVIPIPDYLVVCDFCNDEVTEFPVPVVWGTHALCPKCFKEIQK